MGEFGELLVKAISATLGRELAKYPLFAEYEWPILIGLICLAIAILVIRARRSKLKDQTPAVAPKATKTPQEYGRKASALIGRFALAVPLGLRIPLILSIVALALAAFADMPYDFFVLLRVLVFLTCVILSAALWKAQIVSGWFWLVVGIALLYNPLLPIHLHRDTWAWINIATITFFCALTALMRAPTKPA